MLGLVHVDVKSIEEVTDLFVVPFNSTGSLLRLIRATEPDAKSTLQYNYATEHTNKRTTTRLRPHTVANSIRTQP